MPPRSTSRPSRVACLVLVIVVPLLLVACTATTGAAEPSAVPMGAVPASPTPPRPAAAATAAASPGGPTDFALWIERQGFGGSSGLRQILKDAEWIRDNAFGATLFDVEDTTRHARLLATWLDEHPATRCWTEYHAAVRGRLGRLLDAYAAAHDARAAGKGISFAIGETLVAEAQSAFDLPAPAGC